MGTFAYMPLLAVFSAVQVKSIDWLWKNRTQGEIGGIFFFLLKNPLTFGLVTAFAKLYFYGNLKSMPERSEKASVIVSNRLYERSHSDRTFTNGFISVKMER